MGKIRRFRNDGATRELPTLGVTVEHGQTVESAEDLTTIHGFVEVSKSGKPDVPSDGEAGD